MKVSIVILSFLSFLNLSIHFPHLLCGRLVVFLVAAERLGLVLESDTGEDYVLRGVGRDILNGSHF